MAKIPHRLYLTEDQMPKQWYNLRADMKGKAGPADPSGHAPAAAGRSAVSHLLSKAGAPGAGQRHPLH